MVDSSYSNQLSADVKTRYRQKISVIDDIDPYSLKAGDFDVPMKDFPILDYVDIVSYFIFTHSFYTTDQLKAYKSLEAFRFYESGFVVKLLCKKVNDVYLVFGEVSTYKKLFHIYI